MTDFLDEEDLLPSKTELKREAEQLQVLGERIVKLTASELAKIPLPESLEVAIREARRLNARGALRRQLQYIGKLMRKIDAEPIQQAVDLLDAGHAANQREHYQLERWVEALLTDESSIFEEIVQAIPSLDRQAVRQLVRNAQREISQQKPPKSRRQLFKLLREQRKFAKEAQN